jgi:hypothetical protein
MWRVRSIILLEKPHSYGIAFGASLARLTFAATQSQQFRRFPFSLIKISSYMYLFRCRISYGNFLHSEHTTFFKEVQEKCAKRELLEPFIRTLFRLWLKSALLAIFPVRIS